MAKSKGRRLAEWLRNLDSNSKATKDTIANSSIDSAKLEDDAVTNPKIADGAVHTANIAGTAVTFEKLHTALVVTESDGIGNNDNDTTVATSAAIKDYVDTAVAGKDNTDEITEGSTNLYFTNERVDDRVNSLLTAGTGITLTYDDAANTLTVAGAAQYGDSDVGSYLSTNGYATQSTIVAAITDSAPATLDTLNELAAALGDDANFSTTTATSLGNRLRVDTAAQGLTSTQQANARTNLGLGTAATTASTDYVSRTFLNTNNLVVNGTSTANQAGFLMRDSESAMMFQIYGTGTQFGFLDAAWGNWDLKKTSGGALEIDINGTLQTVYHTGNLPTIPTNNNQLTNGAGYITSFDITTQTDPKYLRSDTSDTFTGNLTIASGSLTLPAGYNLQWGSGYSSADATIWADGTASIIRMAPTGNSSGKTLELQATKAFSYKSFHVGSEIGSRSTSLSVEATGSSSPIAAKTSGYNTVWGILPWSGGQTYISSGIYYDDGTWVHASDNTNNCLFAISGSGAQWYASNNSTGSWNLASNVSLWNSSGNWDRALSTNATYNGNTIWHAGNDGSGSGLDADTVDGIQGASFLRSDAADSASGKITFTAAQNDLIEVNTTGGSPYFRFKTSGTNNGYIQFTTTDSYFWNDRVGHGIRLTSGGVPQYYNGAYQTMWHAGNDGSGSGLDADTVDGIQGASFLRSDADDTADGRITLNKGHGMLRQDGVYVYPNSFLYAAHWKFTESSQLNSPPGSGSWRHVQTIQGWSQHSSSYPSWQMSFGNGAIGVRQSTSNTAWAGWQTVWTSGNDGSGSGLDADLLDGSGWEDYGRDIHCNQIIADDWLRTVGATGWYNNTYAGGWYMSDTTWIRTYNSKSIYQNAGTMRTDGTLEVGGSGSTFRAVNGGAVTISGNTAWHAGNDGSGSGLDADNLDGYTWGTAGKPAFVSAGNTAAFTSANDTTVSIRSSGTTTAASMSFHRPSAYAINLGLDTDNHFKLGGWSASTVKHTWQNNGTYLATGDIYAYYSDERLTTKHGKIKNAIEKVNSIETFYYTHNEKAKELGFEDDERMHIGVSAQTVEKVMPEVVALAPVDNNGSGVSISGENYKTVQYEKLVPLLIEAIKEQQAQIEELKEKLK